MERAFDELADGTLASPHELEQWLDIAVSSFARTGKLGLVVDQMRRSWRVAEGCIFLWDLPPSNEIAAQLERKLRAHFQTDHDYRVELCTPDEHTASAVGRACSLLAELIPETARSLSRHVTAITLAVMRAGEGRLLTGSVGDGVPGTIILSPEEIANPWDTAAHILHEGLHEKFADITRFAGLVANNITVEFPWRADEQGFTLARALSAFHVYVHFVLYEAAVRTAGERHFDRYGTLDAHPVTAHAMSVVHTAPGPYARGADRCRYFGEQLATTWAPHLTAAGRRLVNWLLECIELLGAVERLPAPSRRESARSPTSPVALDRGVEAGAARETRSSTRTEAATRISYRKNAGLRQRPLADEGFLFVLAPESPRVQLLSLSSWLIAELCDGSTRDEIDDRYLDIVGDQLPRGEARQQVELGLRELEAGHVIERIEG
jgi:hypothetical protein